MPDVVYLTVDQVIELHADALRLDGGLDGIRSEQRLFSAVAQVQQSAFGEDIYQTVPAKAAAYGFFISQNQPFLDGNKRTGYLAMLTFLTLNGYDLDQTEDERAETFLAMGAGTIDQGQFFDWVCNHAKVSLGPGVERNSNA